jgi:hypothetical protein
MSTALTTPNIQKIEELLVTGNLDQFSPAEKVAYINKLCENMGLNPLTKPFEFLRLQGRTVLYAGKGCADQLRKIHGVSVISVEQNIVNDVLFITVKGQDKTGRVDSEIGALPIAGLKGDALANATMKALTKAKRRLTLSMVGLGMLDEMEIETTSAFIDKPSTEIILEDKTFKNIRDLLKANNRSEEQLLKYINGKFKSELKAIEEMEPVHIEEAYRAMGGK